MDDKSGTATDQTVVSRAATFAREVMLPAAAQWELNRALPRDMLVAAADASLTGWLVPPSLGGQELSYTTLAHVLEELAAADLSLTFCLIVHNNLMSAIAQQGSREQKKRWLPRLMSMELPGAFLLTEPGGGSDVAAIKTSATRAGESWVINGAKSWVTNAEHARLLSVYVQTDAELGWRGIASFLIDSQAPGVIREPNYEILGGHALGTGGFRFEDVRVSAADMLAPPGQGFKMAMSGIDLARASVAAMCCGMLRSALELAVDFARQRELFGMQLAQMQGMQWQLADVATDLYAMRTMMLDVMQRLDVGQDARVQAAHTKKFATRVTLQGISECMQTLGANGLRQDSVLPRHLAGAKIAQYLDGTTEIQNVIISRSLFGR